jgi:hypothetical protein
MDVQKTIEFILQHQAKAEAKAERAEAKAERQMAAIRKLIQTGMRMIVKNEESIKELAAAQKVTETKLQGLIDALRRGGNGRLAKN